MKERPTLETERLALRPFMLTDAPDVERLAGDRDVAVNTLNIPHPYDQATAELWISTHEVSFAVGQQVTFAITDRATGALMGAISLTINTEHERAELGYWIGKEFWGCGYTTEAAAVVLRYAFQVLEVNRVFACHFTRNPASGRVMQKIGMRYEGRLRQHVKKWGEWEDIEMYSVLREEYGTEG
ncbi:MAG TPA: GNAT family N-acetyltransferase [Gemmatimonadaceae bacterium]|nr:GNAT family N-acetyltransferase [Gemmatimonadaceae bacterium]